MIDLSNRPSQPLTFDANWGNVTPDIPNPTGLERFLSGVVYGIGLAAAGGLTAGLGAAALTTSGLVSTTFTAGTTAIATVTTAGAVVGGAVGVYAGAFTGDYSLNENIFGNTRSIIFYHDDDGRGNVRSSIYWINANITKTGSGAYRVFLRDENGNVAWDTGTQTNAFRSRDQEDFVTIDFDNRGNGLSGGRCRNCEPGNVSSGQQVDFSGDAGARVTTFYVQKEEGVEVNVDLSITAELRTKTRGVIFNDFQRDILVTRNVSTNFASPPEYQLLDNLPKGEGIRLVIRDIGRRIILQLELKKMLVVLTS